jgi:hypothetical protein
MTYQHAGVAIVCSDQERGNDYGSLRPHHHNIQWAISV